jgi:hypothetical protein
MGYYGTEITGPWIRNEYDLEVDGRRVPYLDAQKHPDKDLVMLQLDRRLAIEGTEEEVCKWVHFIANAMAVAAGYTSFGEHSKPHNRFVGPLVIGVATQDGETFEKLPDEPNDGWNIPKE